MADRPTEDFIRHFKFLRERTGNSPNGIRGALNRDGQLAVSIRELDNIWQRIERHRRFSKRRFIVQSHRKFLADFRNYEKEWKDRAQVAMDEWEDREAEQRGEPSLRQLLDLLFEEKAEESSDNASKSIGTGQQEWFEREFDPDEHSAAEAIDLAETILEQEAHWDADGPHAAACLRALGALKWLRETVDLDIDVIQTRWRKFPVIVVPKAISDKHGIEDPQSLFSYLTQIRLAYMIGADLAAIAMCRAVTEILVRRHYNKDAETPLTKLIKSTEKRSEGRVLRVYNIAAKVDDANNILHNNKGDIDHRDRSRAIIEDWVKGLQEMIVSCEQES